MADFLRCPSCNMTFKSTLLLEKHREKFCIGGDIGKVRETQTPEEMVNRLRHRRKNDEQKEQPKLTEINNEILMDCMSDTGDSKKAVGKMSENHKGDYRLHDHETQLRFLAEAHSKQIEEIMSQNRLLEKQRDDIVQRLNEIAAQSKNNVYLEKMIKHLNTQEQKNEQLLASMKQKIDMLQLDSMKRRGYTRQSELSAKHKTEKTQPSFQQSYIPFYGGGGLLAEISALRLNYLQNGGNDQVILAHLQDLLAEAHQIEQRGKRMQPVHKKQKKTHEPNKWHLNEKLITLEIENQQLEDQLFKLQLQRQKTVRFPKTSNGENGFQLPRFMKGQANQKINTLNAELELLKQEMEIQRIKRQIKTAITQKPAPQQTALPLMEQNKPGTTNSAKYFLNYNYGLEPAPYDPITGFVVFYDYLLGLDPTYRVCRLAVTLCSGGQEMGIPTPLPPVYCEAGQLSTSHDHKKQNVAVLATKQAVPRVRPSPNISLVIEVQASGGYDPYGQEVSRLISRGWVKLDIFDNQNRVISGHWKVPIRILPVKPSLTTGSMNGVPQLENTELYIRLVNARDADAQSLYPIDINNSVLYKYPPLTAAYLFPEDSHLPTSYYNSLYSFPNMQSTYGDVDSPPSRNRIRTQ
ncbi:coiled-coil domain-containing protein 17-like [Bombina bombina]|uniref:coiled-coil domain-containing protein 17-like n=1 Tax=Bombina bombina TaxID=8345 RepID=UPI00235AC659|nr:coiled-coil domain-containing protein 17-like [Bombina bombina]